MIGRVGCAVSESRRTLSTPKLLGLIAAFWLVPQIVAVFVVPGIAEGPAYSTVRAALQRRPRHDVVVSDAAFAQFLLSVVLMILVVVRRRSIPVSPPA